MTRDVEIKTMATRTKTRPDTRLPKLRTGGQGPYLRSLDHLGKSSGVKQGRIHEPKSRAGGQERRKS